MGGNLKEMAEDDEPIAQINIIPFVDIVLVLLIIFMLTANVIAKASIPVDLPRAAHGGESVDPTINLVLTEAGDVFVNGSLVAHDALRGVIEREYQANTKLRATIAADRGIRYERVIDAIDLLKDVGIDAFALNIERTSRR